jgi:imidazolonepropionase-like amidohydrolase
MMTTDTNIDSNTLRSVARMAKLCPPAGQTVWVQVGNVIDGVLSVPLKDGHIVYNDREILYVGNGEALPPTSLFENDKQAPDVVLPGMTVLPGLIEAHAHLFLEGGELETDNRKAYLQHDAAALLAHAQKRLAKLVRLGIMGVRDAGDKDGVGLALSKQYKSNDRPLMPYLDSPGAAIHRQGRYGSFMSDTLEAHTDAASCVASRVAQGADRIKLIPTGIIDFTKGEVTAKPQMSASEVAAIVTASKYHHKQTFAHASGVAGIENAIAGGVDSVEHGFFVTDDQLMKMRDQNIAWVPTLAAVQKQVNHADSLGWRDETIGHLKRILDLHAKSLSKGNEIGVTIIAGSDAGSYGVAHGVDFIYELILMAKSGLTNIDVVNGATGISSQRLGYYEQIGQLKAGYKSRMIFTEHNPLDDMANLMKSKWSLFDGSIFKSDPNDDLQGL